MKFKMIALVLFYLISVNVFAFNWTVNIKNNSNHTIMVGPVNSNNNCFKLPELPSVGVTVKKHDSLTLSIDTIDTCRGTEDPSVIIAMQVEGKLSQIKVSFNHDGQTTNYIVNWDGNNASITKTKGNTNTVNSVNYDHVILKNNSGVALLKLNGTTTDDNFNVTTDITVNK